MSEPAALEREVAAFRDRTPGLRGERSGLDAALALRSVLQEVVAGACTLTRAHQGGIAVFDESGQIRDLVTHGLPPGAKNVVDLPGRPAVCGRRGPLPSPEQVAEYITSVGQDERSPQPTSLLSTEIRYQGAVVGDFYLANKRGGAEFAETDSKTLEVFASQAGAAILHAPRYDRRQRATIDLESLINAMPVGVLVFDEKTALPISVNQETKRMVSFLHSPYVSAEDLLKVMTVQLSDGLEISLDNFPLAKVLGGRETVRAEEVIMKVPNGRSATALVNVTPIRSDKGEIETAVVTLQDITPLRELERLRSEFLDMVSHELRAPLTSIKGSATTLLESLYTLDPVETVHLVRIIDSKANQMRDLIRDLLDAARIEIGTLTVIPEPAEVAGLIRQARSAFLKGGGSDDITMEVDPDLPWVMADRHRVVQVLTKLLSNAARYSDQSSPTRVRAVREGFDVKVSVAEQGRGVRAQRLMDLFRKYWRVEGTEGGREVLGSGLHLAICKGIVEAHGGRVWAENEGPDKPNWLSFTLPMMEVPGTGSKTRPTPSFAGTRAGDQVRVLVVDDDAPTLRYVQDALANAGFAVTASEDPEEALEHIGVNKPNLVVLDLGLSTIDGVALMNAIVGVTDVPVIFLSEYERDEVNAKALETGAADYVVKPFAPTELVARIQAALRRHAAPGRPEPLEPFAAGDLVIDYAERKVTVSGQAVQLTATEYNLLWEFSVNAGRVLSHDHLMRQVWGLWHNGGGGTIRTTVKRLRRKLGDDASDPKYIFTVPRVGYRMTKAETPTGAHH